jgi:hypothetical protein
MCVWQHLKVFFIRHPATSVISALNKQKRLFNYSNEIFTADSNALAFSGGGLGVSILKSSFHRGSSCALGSEHEIGFIAGWSVVNHKSINSLVRNDDEKK